MFCFVDLTAAQNGRERELFDVLIDLQPDVRASASKMLVVTETGQFPDRAVYGMATQLVPLPPGDSMMAAESFVIDQLEKFVAVVPDGEMLLTCSFRTTLRQHMVANHADFGDRFKFLDLRQVLRAKSGRVASKTMSWPERFMAEDAALTFLARAVVHRGGTLQQTRLRLALSEVDTRFRKDPAQGRPSDNPKFISLLVNMAKERGLVTLSGEEHNPYISLTPDGARRAGVTVPVVNQHPTLVVSNEPAATVGTEKDRESERYLKILKSNDFGPFQEVRAAVYDQIDKLIAEEQSIRVRDIVAQSVNNVRSAVDEARTERRVYLIKDLNRNIPWGRFRSFISVLLTRRPVLRSDETALTASWRDLDALVTGIEEDWRVKLDSELIVFLLEHGCELGVYSEEDLAGALFNSRSAVGLVQDCIALLIKEGRCEVIESSLSIRLRQ
jgi:hypothetical protein